MKKIELEELKKIQVDILKYIDEFCIKNNINYYMIFGTLLGAVRHKGYIPWDDDIDICMLREDYDKFMKKFNENQSIYRFSCYENDEKCTIPYGKVFDTSTLLYEPNLKYGRESSVFVDVFVLDNFPNNPNLAKKSYKKYIRYKKFNNLQINRNFYEKQKEKYNFIRYPIHLLFQLFPKRYFVKKNIKLYKKYINVDTGYISISGKILSKEVFNSTIKLEFEGNKFISPKNYDLVLKTIFGDYMKLPPKEKQVAHHRFEAYYKEDKND